MTIPNATTRTLQQQTMGIITGTVAPWVRETGEYVVDVWHTDRTPVILVVVSVLLGAWLYLYFAGEREGLVALPRQYATANNPASSKMTEKQPLDADVKPTSSEKAIVKGPKRIRGEPKPKVPRKVSPGPCSRRVQVLIFYSSVTGKTEKAAKEFKDTFQPHLEELCTEKCKFLPSKLLNLGEIDYEDYFVSPPTNDDDDNVDYFYLFLIPSYNIDSVNDNFLEHLKETHHDFRIDTASLSGLLGYSVFGFGDREGWPSEDEGFCFQAKEADRWMAKLTGRKRAYPMGTADLQIRGRKLLSNWEEGIIEVLGLLTRTGGLGEGVPGSGDADESDFSSDDDGGDDETSTKASKRKPSKAKFIDDVEDLGRMIDSASEVTDAVKTNGNKTKNSSAVVDLAVDFTNYGKPPRAKKPKKVKPQPTSCDKDDSGSEDTKLTGASKEMVPSTSTTYAALTKQGYTIIGTHSGVKLCRWTKSALRGRGSCYKYSFYGIASHQCMEATPSLSCSSKCVFCWRHGTNPVSTVWKWTIDDPTEIFTSMRTAHHKKIKMLRGVPGVRAERFEEAMRIRHCALSLVGEPIFYPRINEFLNLLHRNRISSFLVCNAQHPDELEALKPVTQLYVSVDAPDRDSLKKIDRPLHRDFWQRFLRCMDILRSKRFKQRTVFRLTLVKGFNLDEAVKGYADLVERALPCFIEVKGVTFCGTSTSGSAGLTMANVPFYDEVKEFVEALNVELREVRGMQYGIAAEHAHSCCVLFASERFKRDGKWHALIDYDKFFNLWAEKGEDGEWTPEEYMGAETPEWATWGNGGFDPRDTRVDKRGNPIEV